MIEVTWVGGPDDGKVFEVPDDCTTINFPKYEPTNLCDITDEIEPDGPLVPNYYTVHIYRHKLGYRVYYPYK